MEEESGLLEARIQRQAMETTAGPSLLSRPLSNPPVSQVPDSLQAYHKALLGDDLLLVEASEFSGLLL